MLYVCECFMCVLCSVCVSALCMCVCVWYNVDMYLCVCYIYACVVYVSCVCEFCVYFMYVCVCVCYIGVCVCYMYGCYACYLCVCVSNTPSSNIPSIWYKLHTNWRWDPQVECLDGVIVAAYCELLQQHDRTIFIYTNSPRFLGGQHLSCRIFTVCENIYIY